ncbi:MAG: hypothetical protein PHQ86_04860, partial [Dehalococcoidales bacterium]|nr:hypothetical protein [Dehalococcoidales bacterium]
LLIKLSDLGLIDNNGKSEIMKIIYVQPHNTNGNECISFEWISNWMKQTYGNSEFGLEFANILNEWSG